MSGGVLVTGASGFVGGALVRLLAERGKAVTAAVRRDIPLPALVRQAKIGEIGPDTDWRAALAGIETVAHCAARVHVMKDDAADPLAEFRRVNVDGTRRLAEQAAAAGVKRLVFLSSIKVNGEATPDRPFRDGDAALPRDPYGQSKWEAEQVLADIAARTGLEVTVLRPCLVYGPGVKGNFLSLLGLCRKGLPLPLGGVDNRRSLVYLGNLTDALALCLDHPAAAGRTFLIKDGEDLSTPDLIRRLSRALDRRALLPPVPPALLRLAAALLGKGAAADRLLGSLVVEDAGLRRDLGWQPPFTVEEGLALTARWFRESRP